MAHPFIYFILSAIAMLSPTLLKAQNSPQNRYYHLLVGTYTSGKSEGIYVYRFDSKTGALTHEYTAKGIENPSFLTLSPDGKSVYTVKEVSGDKQGMVNAFSFNAKNGALKFINQQPSGGGDPCYLTMGKKGQHLLVGNYTGGNLSVIPVKPDGALGTPVQTLQHEGKSVNSERQEKAHVHSTVFHPDGEHLFVGDLGVDKVFTYLYQPEEKGSPLQKASTPYTTVAPGAGPRHLVFNKSGKYAYLIKELTAEVSVFEYKNGTLNHLQTASLTDKDFKGEVSAAEIKISPDGKFLYASNRGDANEIVIFEIDQEKGLLNLLGRQSSMGKTPRNFMIDPTGNFLLVANQNSNSIIVFKRDKATGKLSPEGTKVEIGNPVYLMMTPTK